jgi:hypothetical protein
MKMVNLSEAIQCRHCGNISKMEILGRVDDNEYEEFENSQGYSYGTQYDILKCPAPKCKKITLGGRHWHEAFIEDTEFEYKIFYPEHPKSLIGLPEKISVALKAADKVKSIDVNAYAILIRRLLELVCIDRQAKNGSLAVMLNDLADKQEIPDKLAKIANKLKDFGNIGAHAGSGELTIREIPIVTALSNAILEYVYSAPYLANLAESKLAAIKTKTTKKVKE